MVLFSHWLFQAKFLYKIKSQVAGKLEQLSAPSCGYCGTTWGLKCENINSIKRIFDGFIEDNSYYSRESWDIEDWQQYFGTHAVLRTVCYACFGEMESKWEHEEKWRP